MRLEFFVLVSTLSASFVFAQDVAAAAIASLAAHLTVPTTLSPSQTTHLKNAWISQLSTWVTGSEFSSLAAILETAVPASIQADETQVVIGTEAWLTSLPTAVKAGLEKEQSAMLKVESEVLSGEGARPTGGAMGVVAVGLVGVMAVL